LETPPIAGTTTSDASAAQAVQQGGWLEETLQNTFSGGNLVVLFLLLFLVGIAINLTPCVYPLIPITIAFFANQAGENKGQRIQLGFMYMLGIASTYALVGGIAAATGAIFGELFTNPWMLVFLALFMFALALSMFDVYQLGLPPGLSKHLKGRSGVVGALIMGLLVGLAAAPCAGPLIAAVFTEAAKVGNPALSVGMFLAVGLGIGLPYLFLAILSSSVKALPQAGSWLKTVKAVLGLVVIGVGLSYLLQAFGNRISSETHIIIWASFFVGCGLYLLVFETNANNRLAQTLKGVTGLIAGIVAGISLAGLFATPSGPGIQWEEFTMERYEQALASGQPILIDATANWCVQCHEIEQNIFSRQDVVDAMAGVVALRIDWSTGVSKDYIRETQERFNISGLPHIIVQRPGGENLAVLNSIRNPQAFISLLQSARSGR
jgi:thiol:disulfide interchange protein DsbD